MLVSVRLFSLVVLYTGAVISLYVSQKADAREFHFDPSLLQGTGVYLNQDVLNQNIDRIEQGDHYLDLYVNDKLLERNKIIKFALNDNDSEVQPCFTIADIKMIGFRKQFLKEVNNDKNCLTIGELLSRPSWDLNQSTLRLDLVIPQAMLEQKPRGYIPISAWDKGIHALYFKHNTNYYKVYNDDGYNVKNIWSGINSGTNFGLWQLRNQSNYRYMESNYRSEKQWVSVRTYAQRPIPLIKSVLTLGDSFTSDSLFGGVSFKGIKLSSDNNMLPQSQRGYAPEIKGVASTTARVIVRQQGKIIHETVVSPGPFIINDLNNTSGKGDFYVTVVETSGKESNFKVSYSAVQESMRPGVWNHNTSIGKVRNYSNTESDFAETTIQKGISNFLTANVGLRFAKDYQAYLTGGVLATQYGAFGFNTIFSQALVENDVRNSGWRVEGSYNKLLDSGTNITLAAYRYSTKGFRDLQDVLGVRNSQYEGTIYNSDTLNQKNQLSATITQVLDGFGSFSANASTSDYYNNNSRITQFQLGYSNTFDKIAYNINFGRQRTSLRTYNDFKHSNFYEINNKYTENTISLSLSMPLDWGGTRSNVAYNYSKNKSSDINTATLSGTIGEFSDVSYSLYSGLEKSKEYSNTMTWGGALQKSTSKGSYRASYAQGNGYKQAGLATSGTLVIHSGGLTYGPYASDTFALIKAKGAEGAAINNGQGAKIDSMGYAILPSLTPYMYNNISIDPKNLDSDIELNGGSRQVVPFAGSVLGVEFQTVRGRQVLISTIAPENQTLPMGAEVTDNKGNSVGMVGQSNQTYVRVGEDAGKLYVLWGTEKNQKCVIHYQLPPKRENTAITKISAPCI